MAKIVQFERFGDANVLQLKDLPLNEPNQAEVRIKVEAIGINRAEVMFRSGRYINKAEFPSRLGYDASGVIDAIGKNVSEFKIGDRVSTIPSSTMMQYGTYGESVIVPARAVTHHCKKLSAAEGVAIWMPFITAYGALVEYGQVKSTDFVLITAASSSIGYAAIQIAKAAGATVIGSTRNIAKKQKLLDSGADRVIVTTVEDLPTRIMDITVGHGADLILDAISGKFLKTLTNAAAHGATIFEYGALEEGALDENAVMTPFPLFILLQKGLKIQGYSVFEITDHPDRLEKAKQYIYHGLESGALKPVLDHRTFSLEQIVEAHQYMESNQQNGKIVVTIS